MDFLKLIGIRRRRAFEVYAKRLYRERIGPLRIEQGDGFALVSFEGDYETYRAIQIAANKAKLNWRSVQPENIAWLCEQLQARGIVLRRVLCHGTRNGSEQQFFKAKLPNAYVLGTEISDTAERFPMTIQWDFHDVKAEWRDAFDLVFSNSWDHSYIPDKLFPAWLSCVAPGGALALEWSQTHAQYPSTAVIDPFRADLPALQRIVGRHAVGFLAPEIIAFGKKSYVIICREARRTAACLSR